MSPNTHSGCRTVAEEVTPDDDSGFARLTRPASQQSGPTETTPSWHPFYLRSSTLAIFFVIFLVLIVATEVLLAISNHQQGLATSHPRLHYLWTFGPTAILTLVASLWTRVEFQAKLMGPWYMMMKGPAKADRTLLLDYLSMMQPVALIKAIRYSDYAVAAILGVSVVMKIIIVLSTGLITLSLVKISHSSVPITLRSRFTAAQIITSRVNGRTDDVMLYYLGDLSYYTVVHGILKLNLTLPDGLTEKYVHQSVSSELPETTEIKTTVEAFSASLECETASFSPEPFVFPEDETYKLMTANMSSASCQMIAEFPPFVDDSTETYFTRFINGSCSNLSGLDSGRVGIIYGSMKWDKGSEVSQQHANDSIPIILQSTQLICMPTYEIFDVNVSRNGTKTHSTAILNNLKTRQIDGVHAWEIMQAHLKTYPPSDVEIPTEFSGRYQISESFSIDTDLYMKTALKLQNRTEGSVLPTALFDETFLCNVTLNYWQLFAAALAHGSLMEPASISSFATTITLENRIVVRPMAVHFLAACLAVSMLLILVSWKALRKSQNLHFSSSTMFGMASLFAHINYSVHSLSSLSLVDIAILSYRLQAYHQQGKANHSNPDKTFMIQATDQTLENMELKSKDVVSNWRHPVSLHPWARPSALLLFTGVIASLEASYRIAEAKSGLGNLGDEIYMHYLWTAGPAILFSLIALYLGGVDFQSRCLTPYINLYRGTTFKLSIGLNLIDRGIFSTIWEEIRTRSWANLFNTAAIAVASFLTIISASLFHPMTLQSSFPISLQTVTSFSKNLSGSGLDDNFSHASSGPATSLVIKGNLTYPAFTYENLAFPRFQLVLGVLNDSLHYQYDLKSVLTANAIVPALRSRFSCRLYNISHIRKERNTSHDPLEGSIPMTKLLLYIPEESCNNGSHNEAFMSFEYQSIGGFFGRASEKASSISEKTCSDFLWAWGYWSPTPNPDVTSVSGMGCNETLEVIDVAVNFIGTDLRIDPKHLPVVNESTIRQSSLGIEQYRDIEFRPWLPLENGEREYPNCSIYNFGAAWKPDSSLLDIFFELLTTSRYAIPVEMLGDATQAEKVGDAIKFQNGIVRAQVLNWEQRHPANTTNATLASSNLKGSDALEYRGTMIDPRGRRRLMQDAAATRVLEALLGAIIFFSTLGWILMRKTDMLPHKPTSIASVAALLVDSNLFEFLPKDVQHMSASELEQAFPPGMTFRLGWEKTRTNSGSMVDRFGIWAVPARVEEVKARGDYDETA